MASSRENTVELDQPLDIKLSTGLSNDEVRARVESGQVNTAPSTSGDANWQIIRRNAFSAVNILLFVISIGLVVLELYRDAVLTAGVVLMNVVIGIFQELRAKRQLERIALLNRATTTVVRNSERVEIDPSEVVVGDIIVFATGDQFPVDALLRTSSPVQVDEANLTGESDPVSKRPGDVLLSGSACVSGSGFCEALNVGEKSATQRVTSQARAYRNVKTPLQREVDTIIRTMTVVVMLLALQVFQAFGGFYGRLPIVETVQASAVLVALVPQGLILMITVAYSLAVLRIAPKGALIQRINSVESLSHIDLLCVDKTGTLTTQRLALKEAVPFGVEVEELRRLVGDFAASGTSPNKTSEAIAAGIEGTERKLSDEVVFSSSWKWSGLTFEGDFNFPLILGAPEVLLGVVEHRSVEIEEQLADWTGRGYRVLLFGRGRTTRPLTNDDGEPSLPPDLEILGLIALSDELRPGVQRTIKAFTELGIGLKVISGDNPDTVLALAKQAGLPTDSRAVAGRELDGLSDSEIEDVAEETAIFGRVTPEHKERLVTALARRGHWVAMTGDGVNDILALKQASVGIAMRSGSPATRSAADIVLLEDSFDVLPEAFAEGQRVLRGMTDNIKLFLTRTLSIVFLVFFTLLIGQEFPLTPSQNSILATLTVGIPSLALAIWARPGHTPRNLWKLIVQFVLPAAFMVSILSVAVYDFFLTLTGGNVIWSQAAVTTTMVSTLLLIVLFAQPPSRHWVGASSLNGDRRPAHLVIAMYAIYAVILLTPGLREFFDLRTLPWSGYVMLGFIVAGWAVLVRFLWRHALGDRIWRYGETSIATVLDRLDRLAPEEDPPPS
ncbi:MAG: HAD-IC family P-type ATPase [Thermomicrobiales bacterium]